VCSRRLVAVIEYFGACPLSGSVEWTRSGQLRASLIYQRVVSGRDAEIAAALSEFAVGK
jgi:hypothetical protein